MLKYNIILFFLISFSCTEILVARHKYKNRNNQKKQQTPPLINAHNVNNILPLLQQLENALESPIENSSLIQETLNKALEYLCPQQKRVRELTERSALAQIEVQQRISTTDPTPILSFIIPCYNRAHCVLDAIESIYAQNLTVPFEVIVVDDCSTDNSFEILQACEKKYSNFYAYRNPQNKGAPTTRNNAIARARGKYICNADSDDILVPETIEPMLSYMIEHELDAMFFEELRFFFDTNTNSLQVVSSLPPAHIITYDTMLSEMYITLSAGNKLFTKEGWLMSGGFLEDLGHDTWSFSLKMLANGYIAFVFPGSGYLHRHWSNKKSKWWHDQQNRINDISPIIALNESPELFTSTTITRINDYQSSGVEIITFVSQGLKNGTLTLIPEKQRTPLLRAYYLKNKHQLTEALDCFIEAILHGLDHPIVYLHAAQTSAQLARYELTRTLISKIVAYKS